VYYPRHFFYGDIKDEVLRMELRNLSREEQAHIEKEALLDKDEMRS
jgi:hypothetical protein